MQNHGYGLTPAEWGVGVFTLAYVGGFTVWFLSVGNYEFIVYVLTMAFLIGLVAANLRRGAFPVGMLWALSGWGLAHMAGGGIPVGGSVLYSMRLVTLIDDPDLYILKYDQVVHAYGFGVATWVLWHLLTHHFPQTRGTLTSRLLPVLAAMGLGALNEMIEFSAVLMVPETNVGGYYNTALDLVFNAAGAATAMAIIGRRAR